MTKREYLYWVGRELRDLPWKARRNLLADLERHIDEVPVERLGGPQAYARELRESAGLERRRGLLAYLRARRPRNVLVVAVLVVLGAFAIGAAVWTESYQPLVFGYGEQLPQGAVAAPAGNSYSVKFRDGRPFEFGVEVRNSGAFAVRILGVPRPGVLPFSARLYVSRPLVGGGLYGPYSLFRPFDLQPGEVRLLLLRGVYANCHDYSGGTGVALSVFPVRFSFLWNTDTAQIPLPEELAIEMPEGRRCLR